MGTTEINQIQKYLRVLQKLIKYRSTRRYFRTYIYTEIPCILYLYYRACPCLTDIILVLGSLFLYFESYTCITEHILVFQILYRYSETYSCISDLILVLRNLFFFISTSRYYIDYTYPELIQRYL